MSKLTATVENREFFFDLISQKKERIEINMYSTYYAFIKENDKWVNDPKNLNTMLPGLIAGVMKALNVE